MNLITTIFWRSWPQKSWIWRKIWHNSSGSIMKRRKMRMDHIHQHQEDSKEMEEDGIRTDMLMFNAITVVNMETLWEPVPSFIKIKEDIRLIKEDIRLRYLSLYHQCLDEWIRLLEAMLNHLRHLQEGLLDDSRFQVSITWWNQWWILRILNLTRMQSHSSLKNLRKNLWRSKHVLENISLLLLSIRDLKEAKFLVRWSKTLESLVMNGSHLSLRWPTVTKRQVHLLEVSFFP